MTVLGSLLGGLPLIANRIDIFAVALITRHAILAFWFAYVLTRPLGASFADWMGVSPRESGLGWGTGPVSLVLLNVITALVLVLSIRDESPENAPAADESLRTARSEPLG